MNIKNYRITTSQGIILNGSLPFLKEDELRRFNSIGYTGKNEAGDKSSYSEYLNSLGKGTFSAEKVWTNGRTYIDEWIITRVLPSDLMIAKQIRDKIIKLFPDGKENPYADIHDEFCRVCDFLEEGAIVNIDFEYHADAYMDGMEEEHKEKVFEIIEQEVVK